MEVYFVRHGETGGNIAHRHQAEHTPLSFLGEEQAEAVAQKITQFQPTHLVASPLVRTLQTAQKISETCALEVETHPAFIELVRPRRMYGHYHRSFKSMWFYFWWFLGKEGSGESDGESYPALRERIEHAKVVLADYPEDARVVVVSHSVFMTLFEAHMCRPKALPLWRAVLEFYKIVKMPNTHVRKLQVDTRSPAGTCAWSVDELT